MRQVLILAVGLLMLGGCASIDSGNLDRIKEAVEDDKGSVQKVADELLEITSSPEARIVRFCMIEATVVEVMTYRVSHFDPDYAATAYGQIATLQGVLSGMSATSLFPDTDMALGALQIDRVLIEVGQDRLPRLLANLTGGINILGIVDRARVVAAQVKIIAAMVRDTKSIIAAIEGEGLPASDGMTACQDRIAGNANTILAMIGGVPPSQPIELPAAPLFNLQTLADPPQP